MGLADYMSRNPSEPAKPPSTYDDNFIIAQIDVIKETLQIIPKRGRPKKLNNNKTQHNTKTTHNDSSEIKTNTMESSNDSNNSLFFQTKRQRGKSRKANVESSKDSTLTKYNTDKRGMTTNNSPKNRKYSLRSSHKTFQTQLNTTNNDVTNNTQDTQQTNKQAHLPINKAILQQTNSNKQHNLTNQMEHTTNNPNNATNKSPVQKTSFSMRNYLSPTPKASHPTSDDQLSKQLERVFNQQLIAAMINRDTVLREIRDCINNEDQARCKNLSKQIYAKWEA